MKAVIIPDPEEDVYQEVRYRLGRKAADEIGVIENRLKSGVPIRDRWVWAEHKWEQTCSAVLAGTGYDPEFEFGFHTNF